MSRDAGGWCDEVARRIGSDIRVLAVHGDDDVIAVGIG